MVMVALVATIDAFVLVKDVDSRDKREDNGTKR